MICPSFHIKASVSHRALPPTEIEQNHRPLNI